MGMSTKSWAPSFQKMEDREPLLTVEKFGKEFVLFRVTWRLSYDVRDGIGKKVISYEFSWRNLNSDVSSVSELSGIHDKKISQRMATGQFLKAVAAAEKMEFSENQRQRANFW